MKAIISIGYRSYVVDADEALAVLKVLAEAERYDSKWNENTKGNSYHVWTEENKGSDAGSMRLITDNHYRIAKLADEPAKG